MGVKNIKKKPTSRDVAKLSGVSQSTVSRAFSRNGEKVNPESYKRIMKVSKEIGYKPNLIARSMISGKTNTIALVVAEGIGSFYNSIIMKLIDKVQNSGKQCLIFKLGNREEIDTIVSKVNQFQVEAIIITAPAILTNIEKIYKNQDIPIIIFNRHIKDINTDIVYTNPKQGGILAANYLYIHGHKKIGYIRYIDDTSEELEKEKSFIEELKLKGIKDIYIERAEYKYESGYSAGKRLLKKHSDITAVFCTSDLIGIGLIDSAKYEFNLEVPNDLSVLGYDNIEESKWKSYKLDSISQSVDLLVNKTVETIIAKLENPKKEVDKYNIDLKIVPKGSVKNINIK